MISIVSTAMLVSTAAERWQDQYILDAEDLDMVYIKGEHVSSKDIYEKLLHVKSKEEVDDVVGNGSWTRIRCENCESNVDVAAVLDTETSYMILCEKCLALALERLRDGNYEKVIDLSPNTNLIQAITGT